MHLIHLSTGSCAVHNMALTAQSAMQCSALCDSNSHAGHSVHDDCQTEERELLGTSADHIAQAERAGGNKHGHHS